VVIVNGINESGRHNSYEVKKNVSGYVYWVDNDKEMMLILKRDFREMGGNSLAHETLEEFIARKMQDLLSRIGNKGPLSLRETEILQYAAMGKSNKEIAKILDRSECTIKNHLSRAMKKLHANDRTHAVILALYNGWLPGLSP